MRGLVILLVAATIPAMGVEEGFDVNDVSILFAKRAAYTKPYPEITGGESATPILPASVLSDILAYGESESFPQSATPGIGESRLELHEAARSHANWYVQSFRVDDCAPRDGMPGPLEPAATPSRCEFQLRLVMQPIEASSGDNQLTLGHLSNTRGDDVESFPDIGDLVTTDNALHLIYSIPSAEEQRAVLDELLQIKQRSSVRTSGLPLGVHPGLYAESRSTGTTELGGLIKAFVQGQARQERLRKITFFGPTRRVWVFFGGRVVSRDGAPRWEVTQLANVANSKFQVGTTGFHRPSVPAPTPINPDAISREKFRPSLLDGETEIPLQEQVHALSAALNPITVHSENVDCLTCHLVGVDLAMRTDNLRKEKLLETWNAPSAFKLPTDATPFLSFAREVLTGYTQVTPWNMRAFGYYFGWPTVSYRTLTESLRVAQGMNRRLHRKGAGISCRSTEAYAGALEAFAVSHDYSAEGAMVRACSL